MATSHRLAERFAQTLTDHDLAAFADLLHADYVNHNRYAQPGKEGSVGIFAGFLSAFEDFRVEVDDVVESGQTVVGRYTHQYADQRMPLPGAASMFAAAAAALTAILAGHPRQAGLSGGALIALLAWLMLYLRVAAPINRQLTRSAVAHETPADARTLQARWDSIIGWRVALQSAALALLIWLLAFG